jgi:hypothetical protein
MALLVTQREHIYGVLVIRVDQIDYFLLAPGLMQAAGERI